MLFKKEDENYIYNVIGKNVKKYRKKKGLTQAQLAEKIDYSLSFVSSVESKKHQTFSLGALWRISLILGVDMYKLCIDEENERNKSKSILYKCDTCNEMIKIPYEIIESLITVNKMFSENEDRPSFHCPNCNEGRITMVENENH